VNLSGSGFVPAIADVPENQLQKSPQYAGLFVTIS